MDSIHIHKDTGGTVCGKSDAGESRILYWNPADGQPVYRPPCGDCIAINQGAQARGCESAPPPARASAPAAYVPPAPAVARGGVHIKGDDGVSLCGFSDGMLDVTCGDCVAINQGAQAAGRKAQRTAAQRHVWPAPAPSGPPPRGAPPMAEMRALGAAVARQPAAIRQPKVSIITATFNRPDLLRRACESLRAQSDPDWEHLICDDGSSDPAVAAVLEWAQSDPRCHAWRHGANSDCPALLWNFLLDRATGRYVAVLDDDNEKLPQFVEALAGDLDANPGTDLVTCGWVVVTPTGAGEYRLNLSTTPSNLAQQSTCDGGAMLIRRELFDRVGYFSEDLRTNEDWQWLRRAAALGTIRNRSDCFATYRVHQEQRMTRCLALGNATDVGRVKSMALPGASFGIRFVRPPPGRLTRSQEDAISSADRGLQETPWLSPGDDLAIVMSPFQQADAEIAGGIGGARAILSVHIEDPYALNANLERCRAMAGLGRELWIATNDAAAEPAYRAIVGNRTIVCPLLGRDSTMPAPPPQARDIDVLLCGYAYPSRKRFMADLLPRLAGLRVVLAGDEWAGHAADCLPTQDLASTYALYARAKTIVCLHRTHGDCSDGPVEPQSVNRGFCEGAFGARVFIDHCRPQHSLRAGDVEWYSSGADLAAKVRAWLAAPGDTAAFAARCGLLYSYQARMVRMVNCVRAPRYLAVVP